eukprot:109827-Heterocapsa_arctica.AAC.1
MERGGYKSGVGICNNRLSLNTQYADHGAKEHLFWYPPPLPILLNYNFANLPCHSRCTKTDIKLQHAQRASARDASGATDDALSALQ